MKFGRHIREYVGNVWEEWQGVEKCGHSHKLPYYPFLYLLDMHYDAWWRHLELEMTYVVNGHGMRMQNLQTLQRFRVWGLAFSV